MKAQGSGLGPCCSVLLARTGSNLYGEGGDVELGGGLGVSATHSHPTPSGGGRKQDLRLPKRRPPGRRYQCSGDGCRLACRSMKELLDHIRVHYRPTQSMEGKIFRCSSPGCVESFPNMQVLMEHIKVHYKPNRYFKCENCMTRFRTYRSLFKHLHSCSSAGTAAGAAAAAADTPPLAPEKPLPEKEPPGKLFPGPAPHTLPGPFLPYVHPGSYALPPAAVQSRLRPFLPGQGLPISNAVWKKSQGERKTFPPPAPGGSLCPPPHRHSSNSRIVWEHTRGRYNCLQCSYSTASREEVTQHVEDHRKNPSPPGRLDGEMDTPRRSFLSNPPQNACA
uniref:Zinc finger protein 414 n=1 Tax=Podarcis muralis TaxID=64176 RepID=A0A670KEM9_PODMU